MKHSFTNSILFLAALFFIACNGSQSTRQRQKNNRRKPANYANYVIEVGTYHTRKGIDTTQFVVADSMMEQVFTSKQPGFISRESGLDSAKNWLVVVSYDNAAHADAAFKTFKTNPNAAAFRNRIDTASLHLQKFKVKDDHSAPLKDLKPYVIELATFKLKPGVNRDTFEKRDLQVEKEYISGQDGYITRKIGTDENGENLMVIYWKTLADADRGMKQFRRDQSVADYSKMIDWSSVKLKRFKALN